MVPAARWLVVLAVAVGLAGAPVAVRAWPVEDREVTAAELLRQVRDGAGQGWSGEVRTQGAVEIPESDSVLDGVARLLGEASQLRVWWRSADDYRVDRVRESGETDLVRDGATLVRWRYEGSRLTVAPYSPVRLPDDPDVLPPTLASRMLAGADEGELRRLPATRVAGRPALGLRLEPSDERSTIARVDLWADAASGLPLRVEVYDDPGVRTGRPVLASEVERLDLGTPDGTTTDFPGAPGLDVGFDRTLDEAAGADRFAPYASPGRLAGLAAREESRGQPVGVYGRGPTALAVVPVRDRVASGLREQLRKIGGVRDTGRRVSAEVGPLSLAVTTSGDLSLMLVGTVTPQTVQRAAAQLEGGRG